MGLFDMNEMDVKIFLADCLKLTARHSGIKDIEWKSAAEIREILKAGHPETLEAFEAFEDKYNEWWKFTEDMKPVSASRILTPSETQSVLALSAEKDSKREELRAKLGLI